MMKRTANRISNEKGFFGLISLLLALVIIAFLCYKTFNAYYGKSAQAPQTGQSSPADQPAPVTAANYQGVLNNVKSQLNAANQKAVDRAKEYQ